MTNTFASFFVFVIFCAIKCSIKKKKRKARGASERRRKKGACIRGAIAPKVEKTKKKKKSCKISGQHRQASAKSIVCEC